MSLIRQSLGDWHRCGCVKLGRVNSDVLFRWFVAAHFLGVGACLPTVLFLCQSKGMVQNMGAAACSRSILTLVWKGTVFQELVLETSVVPPFHCCSCSSPCPFSGSVRGRQDCSSAYALSKRKHVADNSNAVTEDSKLFWLITIFLFPLSTHKCSKRNCIAFLKMKVRKN